LEAARVRHNRRVFEGFDETTVDVGDGVQLRLRSGGSGPPVVLLHGHPRTHTTWHRVAPMLVAGGHAVICPDLRGYGQSSKPDTTADHSPYSKRAMAVTSCGSCAGSATIASPWSATIGAAT
jgi:pimeloyl-ACP methyl ester carboxylesterase